MKHLFIATKLGWDEEKDAVWFDTEHYSKEAAYAQFKPFQGIKQKRYEYTAYEYDGQKYHDVTYLGEFEDNQLPHNTSELIDIILKRGKKSKIEK